MNYLIVIFINTFSEVNNFLVNETESAKNPIYANEDQDVNQFTFAVSKLENASENNQEPGT